MPQIAPITVKKNDAVTDIVYAGVVPSAGDRSPAIWRSPVGAAPAFKPELRVRTLPNSAGTVRRLEGEFAYPITAVATDGKVSVVDKPKMSIVISCPQAVAQTEIDEFVSQGLALMSSSLFKDMAKSGYAAT